MQKNNFTESILTFAVQKKKQKYRRIIVSDTESSCGTDSGGQFWSIIFDFEADVMINFCVAINHLFYCVTVSVYIMY